MTFLKQGVDQQATFFSQSKCVSQRGFKLSLLLSRCRILKESYLPMTNVTMIWIETSKSSLATRIQKRINGKKSPKTWITLEISGVL